MSVLRLIFSNWKPHGNSFTVAQSMDSQFSLFFLFEGGVPILIIVLIYFISTHWPHEQYIYIPPHIYPTTHLSKSYAVLRLIFGKSNMEKEARSVLLLFIGGECVPILIIVVIHVINTYWPHKRSFYLGMFTPLHLHLDAYIIWSTFRWVDTTGYSSDKHFPLQELATPRAWNNGL